MKRKRLKVLLVDTQYKRMSASLRDKPQEYSDSEPQDPRLLPDDESLWYPPLGLLKLARYHSMRGDEVGLVIGTEDDSARSGALDLFGVVWDRVYITTLFTWDYQQTVDTINYYKDAVCGTVNNIHVGGIMATLMADELFADTGIQPFEGVIDSARKLGFEDDTNIDLLAPDYGVLADMPEYAIHQTYYAYTTRGCTNTCPWCGVPKLEGKLDPYIDIKPVIRQLRDEFGDKPRLKLMDNNVLASPDLGRIVDDLVELGYGKKEKTTGDRPRERVLDFNQGVDATHCTKENLKLLSRLNISPMRIAFDNVAEKRVYERALRTARAYGFTFFSNYMLYNFNNRDNPRDLHERLMVNIRLNEEWRAPTDGLPKAHVYSFPMRFAPIFRIKGEPVNRTRDYVPDVAVSERDWLKNPAWTRRFIRNIEIIKGAAHGAISPTPGLAARAIGESFEDYLTNLYMPEELIRYRNRHERRVYDEEPDRPPGDGQVEEFREFMLGLLRKGGKRFEYFHNAVTPNRTAHLRKALDKCKDPELRRWLEMYDPKWRRGQK